MTHITGKQQQCFETIPGEGIRRRCKSKLNFNKKKIMTIQALYKHNVDNEEI